MLEVNYRPDVKITKLGAKISDIRKQAKKDGLIELDQLNDKVHLDLDSLLDCLDGSSITIYKPFNTEEQWQWFVKKDEVEDIFDDYFDSEY